MAKPLVHSRSSARKWGGVPDDYLALHDLMDSSKEALGDNRHRALTHHAQFAFTAEQILGHTVTNSAGREIHIRDLVEQHCLEDMGGVVPCAHDWLRHLPRSGWMHNGLEQDTTTAHAVASAARHGGQPCEYLALHGLLHRPFAALDPVRARALTHHTYFVELVCRALGETIKAGGSSIPVRSICREHIEADLGHVPTAADWLETLLFEQWMGGGSRHQPPSARGIRTRARRQGAPARHAALLRD
jgi:hypothetical protein